MAPACLTVRPSTTTFEGTRTSCGTYILRIPEARARRRSKRCRSGLSGFATARGSRDVTPSLPRVTTAGRRSSLAEAGEVQPAGRHGLLRRPDEQPPRGRRHVTRHEEQRRPMRLQRRLKRVRIPGTETTEREVHRVATGCRQLHAPYWQRDLAGGRLTTRRDGDAARRRVGGPPLGRDYMWGRRLR